MKQFLKNFLAIDKLAHFAFGGLICAIVTIITLLQDVSGPLTWHAAAYCLIGTVVAFIAALIKDFIVDENADFLDIVATILGCIPVWIAVVLGVLFNILSQA